MGVGATGLVGEDAEGGVAGKASEKGLDLADLGGAGVLGGGVHFGGAEAVPLVVDLLVGGGGVGDLVFTGEF